MYNRIDLPLAASPVAGLVAAGPWLVLLAASLVFTVATHPLVLAVTPALLTGAISRWRRCGNLRHSQAVVKLAVKQKTLFATLADGRELEVSVAPDSRIGGRWLVLGLDVPQLKRSVPVVVIRLYNHGNADANSLRRLRVWLRLMPEATTPLRPASRYRNPLQTLWPGGKSHVRDAR